MPRAAVFATIVAVVALNLAVAYAIARAVGMRDLEVSGPALWALLAVGALGAVVAVARWRAFVAQSRARREDS